MEKFLNGRVVLHSGDSRDVLRTLPDNSIDSIVTDPPYALVSIVKRFGKTSEADNTKTSERTRNRSDGYARLVAGGFMGKKWDTGETAFAAEFWAECLRVLKPGGHVVAFSGTRTVHRMVCAIEDAGFEIRDQLAWMFGSGFPKSHDVSKGIDKAAGAQRAIISQGVPVKRMIPGADQNRAGWEKVNGREYVPSVTAAATDEAAQWEGWGTALKPAQEPICLARKPLSEKTVAANVLKWGTGALNIGACRVATDDVLGGSGSPPLKYSGNNHRPFHDTAEPREYSQSPLGRWPANVLHDGSEEVVGAFPNTKDGVAGKRNAQNGDVMKTGLGATDEQWGGYGTPGVASSAARFFYSAKASKADRNGSKHPTVKPVDVMQWLCRLVTPKDGTVLDPFSGTGTTGEAAFREGFNAVLIEREEEYQADIRRRMALCLSGPDERARESIKAKTKDQPIDAGPLFATTRSDFQ